MTVLASSAPTTDATTRAGVRATYAAFIGTGFVFASWASRIPQVRAKLGLTPAQLGLLLLAIAAGSLVALPLSGGIVHRFGSRRTVALLSVVDGLAVALVAVGYRIGVVPVLAGLLLFGFAQGGWDVAMNVQGAIVEQRLGRSIMPRFHAGFSIGTVAGAGLGAGAVALGVPVTVHLLIVAALIAALVPFGVRGFVPDHDSRTATHASDQAGPGDGVTASPAGADDGAPHSTTGAGRSRTLQAWLEPRTLLIGLFVLLMAFAEGTGNDWSSLALIDGYHVPAAIGTLGFATFLSAMTLGRWYGPYLLDRFGRVPVVRAMALVSLIGALVFVFGGSAPVAFAGAVLWGFGLSLGFPVGMSAGADDPAMAPARVSVVASIGYCAFLGGPPLVGLLGDHVSVLRSVTAVAVALAAAVLVSGAVRPIRPVAGDS